MEERTEMLMEVGVSQIHAPSGVFAEDGTELTNLQILTDIARHRGAYAVFLSMDGFLSPSAATHNSSVTRSGEGEYLIALMAKYPPEQPNK